MFNNLAGWHLLIILMVLLVMAAVITGIVLLVRRLARRAAREAAQSEAAVLRAESAALRERAERAERDADGLV